MKLDKYLKDKLYFIIITVIVYFLIFLLLISFKVQVELIIAIMFLLITMSFVLLLIDYFRKRDFYNNLINNINLLDKSYLVLETLIKPEFYDGELLYQALYEINKSMNENVRSIEESLDDFKDYIEAWIHEIKIPLSTLILMSNNLENGFDNKIKLQLKRLDDYLEQILYYVRSENAEKDYLIKETNLADVIKNVGLKNMDEILFNKIDYIVTDVDYKVLTDSKWLEFILGQIINNSIKYKKNKKSSYIKIFVDDYDDRTTLGIGIKESDLKCVFDKSFTGENGRCGKYSTGMGLYIAKNMCEKLGHKIDIESVYNEYTKVFISFAKNEYYDVLK